MELDALLTVPPEAIDSRVRAILSDGELSQADADQLATDASRLAALSEDRLDQFRGAGFFLRIWYKFSGTTAAMERATVADLVAVQSMAWQCLAIMQKQGLFSARAMAMVRNNLSQLASAQQRLGGLVLDQARKVGKLAQDVRVLDWRESIKVREDYLALPELLRVVKAAFEYVDKFDEHGHAMERLEQNHDLELVLTGLGISPRKRITLGTFAEKLADEVISVGVDQFAAITEIRIGDRILVPGQVSGIVAGRAFGCLIDLANELPHALRITRSEPCDQRGAICRKAALSAVSEPDVEYELANLAKEIVAGVALVRDLLTPSPALQGSAAETAVVRIVTIDELLARHVPLKSHALVALEVVAPERQSYVSSLESIAIEGEASAAQRSFLASVARVLGVDAGDQRSVPPIGSAALDVRALLAVLSDRTRQAAWIFDATFLATRGGEMSPKSRERILQMCQLFDMKNDQAEFLLRNASIVATSEVPAEIADVVCAVHGLTGEWSTIVDFRKVSLTGAFHGFSSTWREEFKKYMALKSDFWKQFQEVGFSSMSFGDEGFMAGAAISIGRKLANSSHQALVDKVRSHASYCRSMIHASNLPLRAFGCEPVETPSEPRASELAIDANTDCKNVMWNDNMQRALENLEQYFDAMDAAMSLSRDRLAAIEAGKWC